MRVVIVILLASFFLSETPFALASSEGDLNQQVEEISSYIKFASGKTTPLSEQSLREVILNGASFGVVSQEKNGHFGYEYVPAEDQYRNDDNMIRQAGMLFMLSEVYKHQTHKDQKIAETIEKSINYFKTQTIKSRTSDGNFSCITNKPGTKVCSLGTASLALIGILNYIEAQPDKKSQYKDLVAQYKQYLVAARFPDAGYSGRYTLTNGFGKDESAFYNGEAMLALVKYYQYHQDESVKHLLFDSFAYLDNQPAPDPNLYLWIMAALKDMQQLWPQEAFVTYTSEFTNTRLNTARLLHFTPRNHCALYEGLTSAYSILEEEKSGTDLNILYDEIEFGLSRTAYLQVDQKNSYQLTATPEKITLLKIPNLTIAKGGFLTATDQLTERIDFTQHCVSSYLQKLTAVDGKQL